MATWMEDILEAFKKLDGIAHYSTLYDEVKKRRDSLPDSYEAMIRGIIETHSSDSKSFNGNSEKDIFYSVEGIGKGIWGVRSLLENTPLAPDLEFEPGENNPNRIPTTIFRVIRDTKLTKQLKLLHSNKCQICGTTITFSSGKNYSEAHHIRPLGREHNGPDISGNIIILCPNHHAMLDYGVIELSKENINDLDIRAIDQSYIDYHNKIIAKSF